VPRNVVRTQLVANNDLASTYATWAGASPPEGVDGRSIAPLLSATSPPAWRTALLNERHLVKPDDSPSPSYDAIFTASGKRYVEYATDEHELYDLRKDKDPYELSNSYDSSVPQAVLASRLHGLKSCVGNACRLAEGGTQ
jgi:N-acetylglucosamine-6-sulfatase